MVVRVKTAKGRKKSSTTWLQRQLNDPYVKRAKEDGYRSRAAYKLAEIQERFEVVKPGDVVVDLGAAPGGWCQVALPIVSKRKTGHIIGIDLQEMEPIEGVELIMGDFLEEEGLQALENSLQGRKVNVVLSDMAAKSCGHKQTDHLRIMHLCDVACDFAYDWLEEGGTFLAKVLQGGAENALLNAMKKRFKTVKHVKPDASRKDSAETYVLATGFRG